ncbi:LLM class flavin-dependent oxidoreductase [Streptomyces youssoufiensis]
MRVGTIILPEHSWRDARRIWRSVEDMGFDHAWTYDHLAWRSLRNGPWFDSLTTLAAAATATARISLGTLVASPNFRHPVTWAKAVMTLDDLSDGRVVAGVGAGGRGHDARALGRPELSPRDSADRFREFVELADRLLRGVEDDYRGRFYQAVNPASAPGCVQRPRVPFALAASGPRGFALAAEYAQTWVTNGDPRRFGEVPEAEGLALIAAQRRELVRACAAAGRTADLATLVNGSVVGDHPLGSVERFVDFAGACAEAGFTDLVVHYPRPDGPFAADLAVFERIASQALPVVRAM